MFFIPKAHNLKLIRFLPRIKNRFVFIRSHEKVRFESTESNTSTYGKSFRGQVYESVSTRLARERQERKKYIEERDARGILLAVALIGYWLGTTCAAKPSTSSTIPLVANKPPKHNVGDANLQAAWADFVEIVGRENVSTTSDDILNHARSNWDMYDGKEIERPFMIVYPSCTDEVSAIMKICHKRLIPVTAYSGGTSLEGQYTATRGGICLDFGKMDKILQLNPGDMDVIVQPGVRWEDLHERLAKDKLFFPPDPGPGAMIGGMIGTGCSGTNAYRYGTIREWVINVTVVLADGTVIKTRQRPRKSSAGYDLTRMFIGSEGTLGLITEATLRLTALPSATSVAICTFPSIRKAAECASRIVNQSIPIAAIELLDEVQMQIIKSSGLTRRHWMELPTLFFKFSGTPGNIKEQEKTIYELAKSSGSIRFEMAQNKEEQEDLWSARKQALWSVMALREKEGERIWTGDVAVPLSRLADVIEETHDDIQKSGLVSSIIGHLGDGNFHGQLSDFVSTIHLLIVPALILYNHQQRKTCEGVIKRMVQRAIQVEGTVSGEHGVGLGKRDYLNDELGKDTVDAMRQVSDGEKTVDDPCLLVVA